MRSSMKSHKVRNEGFKPSVNEFTRELGIIQQALACFHYDNENTDSWHDLVHLGDAFAVSYLEENLTRKSISKAHHTCDVPDDDARRAETLSGFLLRETVNAKVNSSETFGYSPVTGEFSSDLAGLQVLTRARDIICDIVGVLDVDEVLRNASFGNGASATRIRRRAQKEKKILFGRSVTSGLHDLARNAVESCQAWRCREALQGTIYINSLGKCVLPPNYLKKYAGAVLDYVPKTALEDRIILKEPELNGFFQKGTGKVLRNKLKTYRRHGLPGMDLNTSGDLNSGLAQAGSLQGHLATVDARRASDSLTLALFEFLFPKQWYDWFTMIRSPYCLINGRWHRLGMMSGMGNGFTFEAESIIFYAIGLAACMKSNLPFAEQFVSIHGDDLIVPADIFDEVHAAYTAAHVEINIEKSFGQGPFRESCGGHFYNGRSVKPFYVKTSTGANRGDWFWLANSLHLWLSDRSEQFLKTDTGRSLVDCYTRIRHKATSGKPEVWRTSYDRSRRSGVYGPAPMLQGACYKTRNVVDVDARVKLPGKGSYLSWLNQPTAMLTVLELCRHKRQSVQDPYSTSTDTHERERFVKVYTWTEPFNTCVNSLLWKKRRFHKLR